MTNVTHEDFIKMMREFKNTIESTIEVSVNTIGKKINDNLDEKLQQIDRKMQKLGEDVSEVDRKVKESDEKNVEMNMTLKKRIEVLEMNNKRMTFRNMKSDTLQKSQNQRIQKETEELNDAKATNELTKEKVVDGNPPRMEKQQSWSEEVEEAWNVKNRKTAELDRKQWTRARRIPNSWIDEIETCDDKDAAEEKDVTADKPTKKLNDIDNETRKHVENWFGYDDETDTNDEESSEEDIDDGKNEEWKKIERKKKKSEKNRKQKIKRKNKMEETLMKAQRMVGLGPFTAKELEKHSEKEDNFETVKIKMVENHLRDHYKYNSQEIKDLKIASTKIAIKEDIFIYIAVENVLDIKDLYRRKAEVRRDDLILKNYIPPQLFARFTAINKICRDKRQENQNLKTQVRFGSRDLEVMIKTKGDKEPFTRVDLKEFIGEAIIPNFDDSQKWRHQPDRRPRRRVTSSRNSSPVRLSNSNVSSIDEVSSKIGKHQLSLNSNEDTTKKLRQESSLDSCYSVDLAACKNKNALNVLKNMEQSEMDVTL